MKQDRRNFLKAAGATFAAMTLSGCTKSLELTGQEKKKPNILFIMTDQQHAGMMSCAGNKWLKTPAMDSLARDGIRFEKAYSANPVCVPSRISMATGVMPGRLGVGNNKMKIRISGEVDNNSLGKIIKRAGYDTFYGGKVHMSGPLNPRNKNAGYDEYYKDSRAGLPTTCLEFIKKKRSRPFFAVASFINPHDICFAHLARNGKNVQGVLDLHRKASSLPMDKLPPLPANYAIPPDEPAAIEAHLGPKATTPSITMRKEYDEKAWRINRWIYHRLTEQVDKHIGTILDGLKDAGLADNTLIVFTSDHGNMDASHRLASKGLLYEESVGVPLIIKYKGAIAAGQTNRKHLVSTGLDILPTLCDYAGVAKPAHLLGKSLRPLAEGKPVDKWRSYVASENTWSRMIRSEKFKYCVYESPDSKESLVDMENDPGEMRNLVDNPKFRDVLSAHRKLLSEWIKLSDDKDGSKFIRKDNA